MTIPSYTEEGWTPCVYTQRRLIPPSESAIHKNNKALRLKSTKCWDSLNKSYCWQRAALCVLMCVCVHVSGVYWTHFRSERKCWQREFIFLSEMYTLHHSRSEAHVPSVSMRAEPNRSFPCFCLPPSTCVWQRECVYKYMSTEWFMEKTEAWLKRTRVKKDNQELCASKGFLCVTYYAS